MKNDSHKKEYDCVKMQREIRDKLSKRYIKNPDLQRKELEEVKKEFSYLFKNKEKTPSTKLSSTTAL